MKKLITKASAFALSGLMAFSSMPVYAAEPIIKYTDPVITEAETSDCIVTIDGGKSSFTVTLPKKMDGNAVGGNIDWNYKAKVEGDIAGNETVSVVPEDHFYLSQTGKADIDVEVRQEKTVWDVSDVANAVEETGRVFNDASTKITAGDWTGSFFWNIKLEGGTVADATPETPEVIPVTRAAGIYDASGNFTPLTKEQIEATYTTSKNLPQTLGLNNVKIDYIVIPSNATKIGTNAFYNCFILTPVNIPNSVTSIGTNAFYNVPHIYYNGTATGAPWGALAIN